MTRERLQKIMYGVLVLVGVKLFVHVRRLYLKLNRIKRVAEQLPSPEIPEEKRNSLDLFGGIRRRTPQGEEMSIRNISKNIFKMWGQMSDELAEEGVVCSWLANPKRIPFPFCVIMVKDINLVRELLSTKMLPYLKKGSSYRISEDLIGKGVLSTTGEVWHRQRVVLEKGFTNLLIQKQLPMVKETAQDLVDRFDFLLSKEKTKEEEEEEGFVEVDLIEEMLKTTLDVLGRAAFSYNIGSVKCRETKDAPLFDAFEIILNTILIRIFKPINFISRNFIPSKENMDFRTSMNKLDSVIKDIIHSRKEEKKNLTKEFEPRDLLDILLHSEGTIDANGNEIKLSEKQILENMRTILFAGHDTTAAALTWAFYLLAKHPEAIQKILKEFEAEKEISMEVLEKSEYLNAVVLEVLRLYPSAAFTREATQDIQLGKYVIPEGIEIFVFPYLIQRSEEYFHNPNEFVPERWINTESEDISLQAQLAKVSKTEAFLPFSLGKRNCVGRKLALLEIRVVLLTILTNFNVLLPEKQPDGFQDIPHLGLTAFPKDVRVIFKRKK